MHETRFIVVRHGETAWNAQGRIQGHLDSPLNEEGLAQALMVGERLVREPIDALYCSDLGRVQQTVQPLVDRTGIQPRTTERLRERRLGVFQGLTSRECQARYPEDYTRFHARDGSAEHLVIQKLFGALAACGLFVQRTVVHCAPPLLAAALRSRSTAALICAMFTAWLYLAWISAARR